MMAGMCPPTGSRLLSWKSAIVRAVSYEIQNIEGRWREASVVYRDNLARIIHISSCSSFFFHRSLNAFIQMRFSFLSGTSTMVSYRIDIE